MTDRPPGAIGIPANHCGHAGLAVAASTADLPEPGGAHDPITGILTGAGSFGGTVLLLLAMAAFLSPAPNRP